MIENFIGDATQRMDKSVEATHEHFNSVRTGRATPALLDRITIDYYGTPTPLKNLATINSPEPRMLTIQPFDPSAIKQIEKTIMESDLGLTPSSDGKVIEVRLTRREARTRREANERRRSELYSMFFMLGLDPVLVDTSDPSEIDRTFLDWAAQRRDQKARR